MKKLKLNIANYHALNALGHGDSISYGKATQIKVLRGYGVCQVYAVSAVFIKIKIKDK